MCCAEASLRLIARYLAHRQGPWFLPSPGPFSLFVRLNPCKVWCGATMPDYQDPRAKALQDEARQLRDRATAAKTEAERAYLQRQAEEKEREAARLSYLRFAGVHQAAYALALERVTGVEMSIAPTEYRQCQVRAYPALGGERGAYQALHV